MTIYRRISALVPHIQQIQNIQAHAWNTLLSVWIGMAEFGLMMVPLSLYRGFSFTPLASWAFESVLSCWCFWWLGLPSLSPCGSGCLNVVEMAAWKDGLSSSLVEQGCQQHFCRVFVCQLYCLGWLCVTCANGQNGSKLVFIPQKISCSTLAAGSSVSRQERWGLRGLAVKKAVKKGEVILQAGCGRTQWYVL